ncbi:MAG: hypothetical protein DHS20C21_04820 [Gemmatimonadota bacterium]|nr:MAG: hypothetical protein DHS20C21_04820 [Gemmatimonadota bacterium]
MKNLQFATTALLLLSLAATASAKERYLYILSNNIEDGQNSVIAYHRLSDGQLRPLEAGPFLTRGSGIDNNTNGKLGPNDNDTPLVVSEDRTRLFAVNGHSNTIAAFDIARDGTLQHVPGSPFPSHGVAPVSLALSGDILVAANRNEDPNQLPSLRGADLANYATFRVDDRGGLTFLSKVDLADGQKNTQVLVSQRDARLVFGNDFQVDADFDGDGTISKLFGNEAQVRGGLQVFRLDGSGRLTRSHRLALPETVQPAPEVPTVPLGIWDHPTKELLYVGLVTRNQLGVFRYDQDGKLSFLNAVANSGQDICWLKSSPDGTRLYAVNNLPREDRKDVGSTITVFDISGKRAEMPVELGRVELPDPFGTFVNNRAMPQPNSTAFQFDIDENFLYVINQRVNQTPENTKPDGNVLHTVKLDPSGKLAVAASRPLGQDGVAVRARPQGVVCLDIDG